MQPARLGFLTFFLIAGTVLGAAPYDYWVVLSPGGSTRSANGTTEKVLVVIGNNGAPGSNAGPSYDVILTVKQPNGDPVCSAGYSTQPPIQKGQQLIPLAFQLYYPNAEQTTKPVALVQYVVEANIRTKDPNDDTNPANGRQSKIFTFKSGGQASCQKLMGQ